VPCAAEIRSLIERLPEDAGFAFASGVTPQWRVPSVDQMPDSNFNPHTRGSLVVNLATNAATAIDKTPAVRAFGNSRQIGILATFGMTNALAF
jgi:hypothetical protein